MAIAFDATASGSGVGGSYVYSHTCSGADRYLFVITTAGSSTNASAVSYNGVAMTLIASRDGGYHQIWGLASPSAGTNNVSVTQGVYNGQSVSVSYTGVSSQSNPEVTAGTNSGAAVTTITQAVTTLTDNDFVVTACDYQSSSVSQTAGAGATQRVAIAGTVSSGFSIGFYDNGAPKTPAGSVSMTVNVSAGSGIMDIFSMAIKPAVPTFGALLMAQMAG